MPRYRTIKPEFWTSEQIVECSTSARLLFIGLWNFCDDQGVHPASAKQLKMEVLPGDSCTCDDIVGWITELREAGLLAQYRAQGKVWWGVTGWHHQKIDRPTCKYPPRALDEDSPTVRRPFDERSSKKGIREEEESNKKGREGNRAEARTPAEPDPSLGVPPRLRELIDGWNALGSSIVKPGNGARRSSCAKAISSGWLRAQRNTEQEPAFRDVPKLLAAIRKARFCHAKSWFRLTWLFGKNRNGEFNVTKLLDGAFDDDDKKTSGAYDDRPHETRRGDF